MSDQISELREKLELVLGQLAQKGVKKDSHNSHNPPSQDKSTHKKKSLRKKTGRKSGGQKGHKGHFLSMTDSPDVEHELKSEYCSKCGNTLDQTKQQLMMYFRCLSVREAYKTY